MLKNNIFSIIVALLIMYLSLASSDTFNRVSFFNFPYIDKIVHFGMYFGLMLVIIVEHRRSITNNRLLFFTSLIPFFYGIAIEILQSVFTISRSGSFFDVLSNSAGIIVALLFWLLIKSFRERIR